MVRGLNIALISILILLFSSGFASSNTGNDDDAPVFKKTIIYKNYLLINYNGRANIDGNGGSLSDELIITCKKYNRNKIVIDIRNLDITINQVDLMLASYYLSDVWEEGIIIAVIAKKEQFKQNKWFDSAFKLKETNLKIFNSSEDALRWVL